MQFQPTLRNAGLPCHIELSFLAMILPHVHHFLKIEYFNGNNIPDILPLISFAPTI